MSSGSGTLPLIYVEQARELREDLAKAFESNSALQISKILTLDAPDIPPPLYKRYQLIFRSLLVRHVSSVNPAVLIREVTKVFDDDSGVPLAKVIEMTEFCGHVTYACISLQLLLFSLPCSNYLLGAPSTARSSFIDNWLASILLLWNDRMQADELGTLKNSSAEWYYGMLSSIASSLYVHPNLTDNYVASQSAQAHASTADLLHLITDYARTKVDMDLDIVSVMLRIALRCDLTESHSATLRKASTAPTMKQRVALLSRYPELLPVLTKLAGRMYIHTCSVCGQWNMEHCGDAKEMSSWHRACAFCHQQVRNALLLSKSVLTVKSDVLLKEMSRDRLDS